MNMPSALHDAHVTDRRNWQHATAKQFLTRLDPEAAAFTFQSFDDTTAKRGKLARVIHGDFDRVADKLDALQQQSAGAFVTVNATDGKGRQAHNVERVRAVFVDLDGAPLAPVLAAGLEPHIVVESSPGRHHAYWLTDDCPLDQFERVQRALARRFGGDPSVHDLPRVMRLPGYRHFKGPAQTCKLLDGVGTAAPPYPLAVIVAALGLEFDAPDEKPHARANGDGKIAPGERHGHLFALGRSMARRSTRETVRAALAAENATRCDPLLPDADIDYLCERAFTAKDAQGWQDAPQRDDPESGAGIPHLDSLLKTEKGTITPCEHNAFLLLAAAPMYTGLHFDEFLSRLRIDERDWRDADDLDVVRWLQASQGVARFTRAHARNATQSLAYSRRRDSLREFVERLPAWDGTPRIEQAFVDAWGSPDTALIRAASNNFFVALIARALHPGAQVDSLWAFEGPQGSFKSRSLRELGGGFHAEISAAIGTADFQRELRGIWIAEMSELDSLRGREASTIKRILSAPADRFVQKYALHAESYPRRAVAVATTNEATYWQDATGARRLIPIPCGEIRVDLIAANRLQWLAEALRLHAEGHTWWQFPEGIAEAQEERQQVDPWEDTLRDCIANGRHVGYDRQGRESWPDDSIASATIMRDWLRLEPHQQGQTASTRLGKVMRRIGFVPVRIGHARARGWQSADTCNAQQMEVSAEVSSTFPL